MDDVYAPILAEGKERRKQERQARRAEPKVETQSAAPDDTAQAAAIDPVMADIIAYGGGRGIFDSAAAKEARAQADRQDAEIQAKYDYHNWRTSNDVLRDARNAVGITYQPEEGFDWSTTESLTAEESEAVAMGYADEATLAKAERVTTENAARAEEYKAYLAQEAALTAEREEIQRENKAAMDKLFNSSVSDLSALNAASYATEAQYREAMQAQGEKTRAIMQENGYSDFEIDNYLRTTSHDDMLTEEEQLRHYYEHKILSMTDDPAAYGIPAFDALTEEQRQVLSMNMAGDMEVLDPLFTQMLKTVAYVPMKAFSDIAQGFNGLAHMIDGTAPTDMELERAVDAAQWLEGFGKDSDKPVLAMAGTVGAELTRMWLTSVSGQGLAAAAQGTSKIVQTGLTKIMQQAPFVTSAMGSSYIHAIRNGATQEEATQFGVIAGTIEGLTEAIGADAIFNKTAAQFVTKFVKSGGMKTLLQSPVGAAAINVMSAALANGMEEGAAYIGTGIAQMAIFDPTWRFNSTEFWQDFGMGALLGSVGAALNAPTNTRPYMLAQELYAKVEAGEAVAPQEIDALVFSAQVADMPAAKVEARMQNAMELTQEEYAQATYENTKAVQDEMNAQEQHDKQAAAADERVTAAQATMDNLRMRAGAVDVSTKEGAVALGQLSEEITSAKLTLDKTIESAEAAKQTARKEFESASANARQRQAVIQRKLDDHAIAYDMRAQQEAVQSGLNATSVQPADIPSQEMQERSWENVMSVSERLGVKVVRADAETARQLGMVGGKQGAYIDGIIYIRDDVADPVMSVFKHELTHYVESSRFYGEFSQFVADMFTQQGFDLETVLNGISHEYALEGIQLDRDGAMREFVADFVKEQLLTDEKSINTLVRMQRVPARGIYNWIRATISKIGKKHIASRQLVDAERMFRKAFAAADGNNSASQYSIKADAKGRKYVELDRNIFVDEETQEAIPENKWPDHLTNWINKFLVGETITASDGKKLTITTDTADEMAKFNVNMTPDQYYVKLVAASHIDELAEISEFDRSSRNRKEKHAERAARGWEYRTAYFSDGKNLYQADISIAKGKQINGIYNIGYIDAVRKIGGKETSPVTGSQSGNPKATILQTEARGDASRNIISSDAEKINPDFTGQADIGLNFNNLLQKYGAIPAGENAARDIQFPRRVSDDLSVSRFARTAGESSALSDEQAERLQREVAEGLGTYQPFTDKKALDDAESTITNNGMARSMSMWKAVVNGNKTATKTDIALGEQLLSKVAAAGDTETAMELIADLCVEATRAGQTVQAFSLLKKTTPAGKLYYMERMVQKLNQDYAKQINSGKMYPVKITDSLKNELLNAKTIQQAETVENRIAEQIGRQIPSTLTDKLNAWRYFSMLGNARTHARNFFGNAFMWGMRSGKDAIGTVLERLAIKDQSQRTKSITADKSLRDYARSTWAEASAMMQGGKQGFEDVIRQNRQIFKTKGLEKVTQFNAKALEAEDMFFSSRAYTNAFAKEMKAKGLTSETITSAQRSEIMNHAVGEALRATFRDANAVASLLNKIENTNKVTKVLVGGVVPFKKTPMNVLKRGVEYSPIGLVQGLYQLGVGVKRGKYTAAEAIDRISSGTVGTGLFVLGAFLAKAGLLRASGEEDEAYEYYLRDLGQQPYSIRIGDSTFTIDWVSPASIPLFMGAELAEAYEGFEEGDGIQLGGLVDVLSHSADPLTQLSMLQGLNDVLSNLKEDELGGAIGSAVITAAQNYASQYIPSMSGQVARTIDNTRRVNTGDPNAPWGTSADYILRKTINKIPGASTQMQPYIDKWGNEEMDENHWMVRLLENTILPGYVANTDMTAVDVELTRLYAETQNRDIIPTRPDRKLTHDGETYVLTASEYTEYQKAVGQAAYKSVDEKIASSDYRGKSDEKKAEAIKAAIEGAETRVREEWKKKVGLK